MTRGVAMAAGFVSEKIEDDESVKHDKLPVRLKEKNERQRQLNVLSTCIQKNKKI